MHLTLTESELRLLASAIADELIAKQSAIADLAKPSAATARQPAIPTVPIKLHFNEKEAAEQLGIAAVTLKKWRLAGRVKPYTPTRPILYRSEEIQAIAEWMRTRE